VRYHRNNLRGAMEDYDMALYVEPGSFLAHYNRGLLRMNVGDDNLAIEDFDKVLEIDPDNTMARFNRALLRENVGDYKGAVDDYSRVIESYPNFEYAYSCRASARRKAGDRKGADADEKWLFKRQLDIYNKGVDAVKEEYSADNDKTRKRSDENVRNYNKMVVADDAYSRQYTTDYRGKVQDRNVFVELEPVFVFTYYRSEGDIDLSSGFSAQLNELNKSLAQPLLVTNDERALSENEVGRRFDNIDALSKRLSEGGPSSRDMMLRALDNYLVQDLEAAMEDINSAIAIDSVSWECFFVRSFIRFKLLETEGLGNDEANSLPVRNSVLPTLDYRLVKSDLDKVLEIEPGMVHALFNRGNVSAKLNDYKSAIVDYTKAIGLDDRFAEAYYNRGLARLYSGNADGGIADLSRAGELGLFQAYNVIKRFVHQGNK
jgi:tetratricopeptide (TPR) repeat protein